MSDRNSLIHDISMRGKNSKDLLMSETFFSKSTFLMRGKIEHLRGAMRGGKSK